MLGGPDHPETVHNEVNLARIRLLTGKPVEALPLVERALATVESAFGPDDPRVGVVLETDADCLKRLGRKPEARRMQRRAAAIAKRTEEGNSGRYVVDVHAEADGIVAVTVTGAPQYSNSQNTVMSMTTLCGVAGIAQ